MTTGATFAPKSRYFSARRIALLAGVAGLGATVFFAAPGFAPQSSLAPSLAYAQNVQRPVGFADIIETVKPAVISVRVKMAGNSRLMGFESEAAPGQGPQGAPGSPMDRFFRRFGMPEGIPGMPNDQRQQPRGRSPVTGQGSGFFISPDGYAVTNNHVVDKAESVEVTTDDGKILTAKVIGADPRTDLALIKVEGGDFPFVRLADQ